MERKQLTVESYYAMYGRKGLSFCDTTSPSKVVRNLEFTPEEIESASRRTGKLFCLASNRSNVKTVQWRFSPSKLAGRALGGKRVLAQTQRSGHTHTLPVAM